MKMVDVIYDQFILMSLQMCAIHGLLCNDLDIIELESFQVLVCKQQKWTLANLRIKII
jgi:hypothetical protein